MPRHSETRQLPYTPVQLFDLIADVGAYPEFLPWCKSSRILERSEQRMLADLTIGYKIFQEKFTSEVFLDRPREISVRYVSGPMTHLTNRWGFQSKGKKSTALSFDVDFDFRSPLLSSVMGVFFDRAFLKMVEAFERRAADIYG